MTASKRLSAGFSASVILHAALLVGFLRQNPPVHADYAPAPISVELTEPAAAPPPPPAPPPPKPVAVAKPEPKPSLPSAPEPAEPEPEPVIPAPTPPAPPAPTPSAEAAPLDPTRVNLATQVPGRARLIAFIRADRLRSTPYAAGLEAALAPTPDYRALLAGSGLALADAFDTVVISTPDPRDVTATFLAVKVRGDEAALREKLAGPASRARMIWETRPGGLVGVPQVHAPKDPRLVVSPEAGWLALARPEDVPVLLAAAQPTSLPVDAAATATTAAAGAPPAWVHALARLETSASVSAPDVIAIIGLADLGSRLDQLPGSPPAPTTGTFAIALDKQLVEVSGTLTFASPSDAARFIASATDARTLALDGFMAKGLLRSVGALGIVESMVLTANGAEVVVTTHASPAELTELLAAAARWTQSFFSR